MSIEHSPPKSARVGILDEFLTRAELASELGCHERTLSRYENLPNGLPSIVIVGRKHYSIGDVKRFIASRVSRPNPVRRAPR